MKAACYLYDGPGLSCVLIPFTNAVNFLELNISSDLNIYYNSFSKKAFKTALLFSSLLVSGMPQIRSEDFCGSCTFCNLRVAGTSNPSPFVTSLRITCFYFMNSTSGIICLSEAYLFLRMYFAYLPSGGRTHFGGLRPFD